MYQVGEYVNYGAHGVCRIEDIQEMNFGSGTQNYYVLHPVSQESASYYLPAESEKSNARLRPVMTKEKIDEILSRSEKKRMQWIEDRKQRMQQFQQILSARNVEELLQLAGCLHRRHAEKELSSSDRDILHKAEHAIEQEFSFALNIRPDDIAEYIRQRLQA